MIKSYYWLTKPGIIYGNSLPAIAAFFLASGSNVDWKIFFAMIFGLACIIGSACVYNNIADIDIDEKMERTSKRALVTGKISKPNAFLFGFILLVVGVVVLLLFTNYYSLTAALLGFAVYVFLYTPLKPRTSLATLVGTIPGAMPPVVGYTAVTGKLDAGAIILFLILFFWQMPHFYAIAIYRLNDYKSAGIPVFPLKKGIEATKKHIFLYVLGFIVACASLTIFGYAGRGYLIVAMIFGFIWSTKAIRGFTAKDDTKWAKNFFFFSLVVLLGLSFMIGVSSFLP